MSGPRRAPLLVAGAVLERDGRILLTRRPEGATYAGCWEFPGGKLERDETVFDAAVRELVEELDIRVRPVALHSCGVFGGGERTIVLSAVAVELVEGEPRPTDGRAMGWFTPREVLELRMPPADTPILEALAADADDRTLLLRRYFEVPFAPPRLCRVGKGRSETLDRAALPPNWSIVRMRDVEICERRFAPPDGSDGQ